MQANNKLYAITFLIVSLLICFYALHNYQEKIMISLHPNLLFRFSQLFSILINQTKQFESIVWFAKNHIQDPFDQIAKIQLIYPEIMNFLLQSFLLYSPRIINLYVSIYRRLIDINRVSVEISFGNLTAKSDLILFFLKINVKPQNPEAGLTIEINY